MDLDGFKPINDTYGHAAGDAVLLQVANYLTHCARVDDVVARVGGDEFAVILERVVGLQDAISVADRIIAVLREPIVVSSGQKVRVGASIGVALVDGCADAAEVLVRADQAMYQAKKDGSNLVRADDAEIVR